MALLSIEAADVQLDCLHRLVAGLCAAPEDGVELLCRLPWAHNLLVGAGGGWWLVRAGGGGWVLAAALLCCNAGVHAPLRPAGRRHGSGAATAPASARPSLLACPPDGPPTPPACLPLQQLVKAGRQTWVPMLEEVGGCCLYGCRAGPAGRQPLAPCPRATAAAAAAACLSMHGNAGARMREAAAPALRCRSLSMHRGLQRGSHRMGPVHPLCLANPCAAVLVPTPLQVVATLQRRAAQLDLRAAPQPYKVRPCLGACSTAAPPHAHPPFASPAAAPAPRSSPPAAPAPPAAHHSRRHQHPPGPSLDRCWPASTFLEATSRRLPAPCWRMRAAWWLSARRSQPCWKKRSRLWQPLSAASGRGGRGAGAGRAGCAGGGAGGQEEPK